MRKVTLLVVAVALAATCSVADAAKRKHKRVAARPLAAQQQQAPGAPAGRVIAGFFNEVGKIGQPVQPAKGKKKK